MEPKQVWLENLLGTVLRSIARELPGLLGADITALRPGRPHHRPVVFATYGIGDALEEIQLRSLTGPTCDAAASEGPITSTDLWNDNRWPKLDLRQACTLFPQHTRALRKVFGAAALPGLRDNGGLVVVSAYLNGPPTNNVVDLLSRYERLVASAIAALSASSGPEQQRAQRVLTVLQSRDVIEQAKGIVMALCRTDGTTAWTLLHDISMRSNTKLGALAAELVDQVVEPQALPGTKTVTEPKARRIAKELWSALKHADSPSGAGKR